LLFKSRYHSFFFSVIKQQRQQRPSHEEREREGRKIGNSDGRRKTRVGERR